MLISGARMDIVGVNLETKNLVLRKREKIKKKNSFKLRIESGESASSFTNACIQLRTFHPLKVSLYQELVRYTIAMKALLTTNISIEMPKPYSKHQSLFIELLNLVYRKDLKEK